MSRPIAYNASGPLSGSIRGGSVNYTVDSGNRDYTTFSSKKWVPSADGVAPIVFVTDSYTQGFEGNPNLAVPLFYSCNGTGSAAIIYTANRVPSSPGNYTDANVALNDLITARGYFILESNDPFEGGDADSLTFDIDASKMSSYPQVGTNWIDLSGNGLTSALINGPTFQTGGWFSLDGTDDRIQRTSNILTTTTGTVVMWLRTIDTTWLMIEGNTTSYYLGAIYLGGGWYNNACGSPSHYVDTNASTNPTSEGYIDGRFHMFEAKNVDLSGWITHKFLDYGGGSSFNMTGDVAKIQMYNRSLTAAESKQNYFGSPIVTDGLVFAVDANNIVSYPKSGTTTYSLTGSLTGTLTNGVGYLPNNGGTWNFDGTDDYINFGTSLSDFTTQLTISFWGKIVGSPSDGILITKGEADGTFTSNFGFQIIAGGQLNFYSNNGSGYNVQTSNSNLWDNNINLYSLTFNNGTLTYYKNGQFFSQHSFAVSSLPSTSGPLRIGSLKGYPNYFPGSVFSTSLYNRALSASEVLQNYQAEQYRFETPAGPVTNGLLLYWDAGNLDSYPGTGTTIYDLSGNGNNGTLINGVGYNQTNGGVLTFDGVDDYVISYNPNLSTTTSTVMGAARYSGATRGRMINSTDVNWLMGHHNTTTENYYAEGTIILGNGPSDTNWRIYSALGNQPADTWSLYVNNSLAVSNNGGVSGPDGISVGAQTYGGTSEFSTGNFSFVLVYNRILTAAEMTQNYNYFKGRFGL